MREKIMAWLRVRPSVAGLDVGDEALRLAIYDGKDWEMFGVRLAPGIVQKGRIKDRPAFVAAVAELKKQTGPKHGGKKWLNVVTALSSLDIYTQVFKLPIVQGKELDEAVTLNLRMVSPIEMSEAYYGWQLVGRDEASLQLEILASFVERKAVDEMTDALFEGGFITVAVESKGLALTRAVREKGAGVDVPKSYLFIDISTFGLDFLVIRNGALYFEYENPWKDLMDEKGEITAEKFKTAFAGSLRQVFNFYGQHWQDPFGAVILSASVFQAEAEAVITEHASVPAVRLTLTMGKPISSSWLVAFGSGLRGGERAVGGNEINLIGPDSRDRFYQEQMLHFLGFWRAVIPVTLGLLLITFIAADQFVANAIASAGMHAGPSASTAELKELATLEASATAFNTNIASLAAAEAAIQPNAGVLGHVLPVANSTGVTITRLTFSSFDDPISLAGNAVSQDHVLQFQNDLGYDPTISAVELPLTGVQVQGDSVTFSMTFMFTPPTPTSSAH